MSRAAIRSVTHSKSTTMFENDAQPITKLIQAYFQGIYAGDIALLRSCFHENAFLYGDINGAPYVKGQESYLDGVAQRESPSALGEDFEMRILSIEVLGKMALVRAQVPIYGFNYYDFLSLSEIDGEWKIVNKLFTHRE